MGVWSGWQTQLLAVASVPNTSDNRGFLADWHSHATTNCRNNPVDISKRISGSTNCRKLFNPNTYAQNYASNDQAAGQFRAQLLSGNYPHLANALQSGHPYDVGDTEAAKVSQDISKWGSGTFANYYGSQTFASTGGSITAPHLHKGWSDFRHTVNKRLPSTTRAIGKYNHAALQNLSHARRVRH